MRDDITIDERRVYVLPGGVRLTGAFLVALLQPGNAFKISTGPAPDGSDLLVEKLEWSPVASANLKN